MQGLLGSIEAKNGGELRHFLRAALCRSEGRAKEVQLTVSGTAVIEAVEAAGELVRYVGEAGRRY